MTKCWGLYCPCIERWDLRLCALPVDLFQYAFVSALYKNNVPYQSEYDCHGFNVKYFLVSAELLYLADTSSHAVALIMSSDMPVLVTSAYHGFL